MDLQGFRLPQSPFFYTQPPTYLVETRARQAVLPEQKDTNPTPDSRYAGWAAPMEDARLTTDYRSQCEMNIAPEYQFASKQFMQHNAKELIYESRRRQVALTGAGQEYDSTIEMPPVAYVKCDTFSCKTTPGISNGVGIERRETVPPLFGTFAPSRPSRGPSEVQYGSTKNLTTHFEGGRNTIRGKF